MSAEREVRGTCSIHFEKGVPVDSATRDPLVMSTMEIANYRCPCETGVEHPDPDKRIPGYPLQPHAV